MLIIHQSLLDMEDYGVHARRRYVDGSFLEVFVDVFVCWTVAVGCSLRGQADVWRARSGPICVNGVISHVKRISEGFSDVY